MDITWLGYSCFRIRGKEVVIVTDPYSPDIGFNLGKQKADIVTVSHAHSGHSYTDIIEGEFRTVKNPGEYEIKGVFITGISTYHDSEQGSKLGKNILFTIEIDGIILCHMGDIGHIPSSKEIEDIGNIGVLFLPIGGINTIDSGIAADIVRIMSPRVVIPMHYQIPIIKRNLDPLDKFLKKLGIKEINPQPKLSINRSTFTENTQIVILAYPD